MNVNSNAGTQVATFSGNTSNSLKCSAAYYGWVKHLHNRKCLWCAVLEGRYVKVSQKVQTELTKKIRNNK